MCVAAVVVVVVVVIGAKRLIVFIKYTMPNRLSVEITQKVLFIRSIDGLDYTTHSPHNIDEYTLIYFGLLYFYTAFTVRVCSVWF